MEFKVYVTGNPEHYILVRYPNTVGELMQHVKQEYGDGPWLVHMYGKLLELGPDNREVYEVPEFKALPPSELDDIG